MTNGKDFITGSILACTWKNKITGNMIQSSLTSFCCIFTVLVEA